MIFVYHHWILLYVNDVSISVYIFCLQSNPAYISIIAQDSRLLPNSSSYIVVHTTPSHTTAKYTRRPADIEQSHTVPAMGFEVRRTSRSYVRPAAATPAGSLELSAIDRVVGLRHMVPSLNVYPPRGCGAAAGEGQLQQQSPASVVREALGKALVDYYPLAGRLVDGPGGPASARVECTGEGAWFVEAVAGCSLEDVGRLEKYPFAIPEGDLLPDEAPGVQPLDLPLMMQV